MTSKQDEIPKIESGSEDSSSVDESFDYMGNNCGSVGNEQFKHRLTDWVPRRSDLRNQGSPLRRRERHPFLSVMTRG